ncbi:MAG: DUF167 domain-containing protein [Candidatus Aenigmarchaeota archaeon]|nr:DUF167 domain-containing protein [Candidatus Aenigmarchaeota archaeon]
MIICVHVKVSSPKAGIKKVDDRNYNVSLTSEPENNKANRELVTLIADYFNKSVRDVKIVKGFKSKHKVVKIEEEMHQPGIPA